MATKAKATATKAATTTKATTTKAAAKPATTAASAVKKAPPAVTVKILAAQIAESHELSKRQAEMILTDTIDLIVKNLKKGGRIRLSGLGILQVRKRAPRVGRNPATGEKIKIKASKKVAFRPLKELKEAI